VKYSNRLNILFIYFFAINANPLQCLFYSGVYLLNHRVGGWPPQSPALIGREPETSHREPSTEEDHPDAGPELRTRSSDPFSGLSLQPGGHASPGGVTLPGPDTEPPGAALPGPEPGGYQHRERRSPDGDRRHYTAELEELPESRPSPGLDEDR